MWSQDEDDLEFKILNIELLSELRETKVKGITLNIESKDVSASFIKKICAILEDHQGKCAFNIQIRDQENGIIKLNSRTKRVTVNDDFIALLDSLPEITYKLN
jgi:DNA polymerase-3 subunit alpha